MGRRELTEKTSWDDCYGAVAYTADALALAGEDGDKAAGALAPTVEKLLTRWEALDSERRAKRRGVGRAHALVRRRDIQADGAVTDLQNDTLGHVKQDREDGVFLWLFPDPPYTVVRLALESELPALRTLADKLDKPETPAVLRKAHKKAIIDVYERGQAAIHGREKAFTAQGSTSARIASWRDDANAVLLGIEGALKSIASERRLGTDWVDSFFPTVERSTKKKAAPEKPAKTNEPG